jgi:hypothetical protein
VDEQELKAVVAARKELGPEHEEHLIAGFLDRIDKELDRRVDEKIAAKRPRGRQTSSLHPGNWRSASRSSRSPVASERPLA